MIILDTNVLSELMRPKPSLRVSGWIAKQSATELFTTSITEEIFFGIELLAQGKRREGLLGAAEDMFAEDLGGRVFGFESDAARLFSTIAAHRRALGKPISHADALSVTDRRQQSAGQALGLRSRELPSLESTPQEPVTTIVPPHYGSKNN
jgi:predicted nucleic acid-binding protein